MNNQPLSSLSRALHWGAFKIAGLYLLIGSLWILFSDRLAERIALNKEMLASLSLYKGWAYVIVTAFLLYWLIQRHTGRLHASEKQLQVLINALPVLISYIDKNQRYQFANEAYEEWFGEKAQGKHIEEVVGQAIYQKTSKYIDKALRGETVTYETEIPDQGGGERFVSATYVPDIAANGHVRGFFTLVQDISEQKEAREKLRQWADAFEGCAHGIAIGAPDTNRIVVCNPAFATMLKCRVEDIVGSSILSLYAASDREHVRHNVERADQIGHIRYEAQMNRKDGSIFPVQMDVVSVLGDDGDLLYRVATAQDISERKQAEKILQESEERYRIVSELTSDYAYKDRVEADGRIIPEWITESFTRITGYKVEETRAPEFWQRFIYPDDLSILLQHTEKILSGQSVTDEMRVITKSGEVRWLRDFANPVWDAAQERVVSLYGAVQDVTERKLADEALRASEERYRTLVEQASDGIFTADSQGQYTEVNSRGCEMLGYTREQILKLSLRDVVDPEDLVAHPLRLKELEAGKTLLVERKLRRKDGSTFFAELSAKMLPDRHYQAILRDSTERRQAEEALRSNELRFRALIEHSSIAFILLDAQKRIVYYAPSNEQLLGYTLEERLQKTNQELIHPDDQKIAQTLLANVYENPQGVFSAEFRLRHKNGSWIWVETVGKNLLADPNVQAIVINTSNITKRKRAEEKLRKSEERYRYLFENNPHPMWIYDRKTLAFLDVNEATIAKYGFSRQEFLNMTILDIRPPEDVERLMGNLAQPRQPLERSNGWRHRLKDGTIIHVEITSHTIETDGHESALVIAQDITQRKLAEEALRESEQKFSIIYYKAPFAAALSRLPDGVIVDVNEAFEKAFGYTKQEVVGKTSLELGINPDSEERARIASELQARGSVHDLELMLSTKSGVARVFLMNIDLVGIDGQRYIFQTAQDITERKRAEDALRTSQAQLAGIFNSAMDAIISTDADQRILIFNPAAEAMFRCSQSEAISQSLDRFIPKRFHASHNGHVRNFAQTGTTNRTMGHLGTIYGLRNDGEEFPIEASISKINMAGHDLFTVILRDITERKHVDEALQKAHDELELKVQERTAALSQANSLLQALMDTMPDQIYFKDLQGRFIRNSRSQASLLGLSDPTQVVGKTDFDFFPHASKAYAEEQEVMRSGKPLIDFEEWVVWPDGRESWVSTTKVPLRNSDGETIGIFGISRDITERKRAEQAIRDLNTDLENQATKLQIANKELEAFSYSVSHDLRAPLRAIDGYTRILVEDYEAILDAEGKRVCSIISAEARRMGQLIDDLLAFSRLGRKEMYSSNIDMKALVVSVLNELIKEEDRERIDFKIARLPSTRADTSLMRQVWVNLLSNALKFTSKKERAVIEVGSKSGTEELTYYVRDSGAGFDMEYANKLFGVFQRLHSESEFEGTGVGLAIVQRIIRRHDGRVWAEGEVDKGATFYFALPRKENHHE